MLLSSFSILDGTVGESQGSSFKGFSGAGGSYSSCCVARASSSSPNARCVHFLFFAEISFRVGEIRPLSLPVVQIFAD